MDQFEIIIETPSQDDDKVNKHPRAHTVKHLRGYLLKLFNVNLLVNFYYSPIKFSLSISINHSLLIKNKIHAYYDLDNIRTQNIQSKESSFSLPFIHSHSLFYLSNQPNLIQTKHYEYVTKQVKTKLCRYQIGGGSTY